MIRSLVFVAIRPNATATATHLKKMDDCSGLMLKLTQAYSTIMGMIARKLTLSADSKDIPFILDIVGWLPDSGCPVNRFRLFAAGISSGGAMIGRFVQIRRGVFKRVTSLASVNPNYPVYTPSVQVVSPLHPSVLFIHGTADAQVPVTRMDEYFLALSANHTIAASTSDTGAGVIFRIYVPGGGHTWFHDYNNYIFNWSDAAP